MRPYAIVVLSALLMSCAMGPDYERPRGDTDDRFRMAEGGADRIPWRICPGGVVEQSAASTLRPPRWLKIKLQKAAATVEEFQARAWVAKSDFPQHDGIRQCTVVRPQDGLPCSRVSQPLQLLPPGQSVLGSGRVGTHQACQ